MRVPSRRLPPEPPPRPCPDWMDRLVLGTFLLLVGGGGLGVIVAAGKLLWWHPLGSVIFLAAAAALGWLTTLAEDYPPRRLKRLVDGRTGDALCRFARDFDCRAVDTWLIRATFEEVRICCGTVDGQPVPLRAADRLREDLRLDEDDTEEIGQRVAGRAGYSLTDTRDNPLYGKITTVGDIVAFLDGQPCLRADQPWPG